MTERPAAGVTPSNAAPEGLRRYLDALAEGPRSPGEDSGGRALERLERALAAPGRHRDSALALLAADALLTEACAEALDGPDPAAALRELLVRVATAS